MVGLAGAALPATAQLIVERPVHIHDDPNDLGRYDWYSPARSRECRAQELFNACAVVFWDSAEPVVLGSPYHASVTPSVELVGPGGALTWRSHIQCMLYDPEHGRVDTGSASHICIAAISHDKQRLEWALGGEIVAEYGLAAGEYRGVVDLTVSHGDDVYTRGIAVTYTVHERLISCGTFEAGSDFDLGGLPAGKAGWVEVSPKDGAIDYEPGSALLEEINFDKAYTTPSGRAGFFFVPGQGVPPATIQVSAKASTALTGSGGSLTFTPKIGYLDTSGAWDDDTLTGTLSTVNVGTTYLQAGKIPFYVGGKVDLTSTSTVGTYTGTFTIQVSYS